MTDDEQLVSVDELDEQLVILTYSRTDTGLWVTDADFEVVPVSTPTASLGEGVISGSGRIAFPEAPSDERGDERLMEEGPPTVGFALDR